MRSIAGRDPRELWATSGDRGLLRWAGTSWQPDVRVAGMGFWVGPQEIWSYGGAALLRRPLLAH